MEPIYKRPVFISLLAGTVIVMIVILGVFLYTPGHSNISLKGKELASHLAVGVGAGPFSQLYSIDPKNTELVPITANTQASQKLFVVDQFMMGDSKYFTLLESTSTFVTNIYSQKNDGPITPVTTSQTTKYNLSYSAASDLYVFEEASIATKSELLAHPTWSITTYSNSRKEFTTLGKGSNVHLIDEGKELIFSSEGALRMSTLTSHTSVKLMELVQGSAYAVDAQGKELAVYSPVLKKIDVFAIKNAGSLSYVRSVPALLPLQTIGFYGQDIVGSAMVTTKDVGIGNPDKPTLVYEVVNISHPETLPIIIPAFSGGSLQRIYTYE